MKFSSLPFILFVSVPASLAQVPSNEFTAPAEAVVITASPLARSAFDLAQPVSALADQELRLKLAPTLGGTLSGEPGVTASAFAPGASRPIIRGLADNRVLVLSDGTDVFDVSSLSPDHTPSVQPLLAQRVEIVRGAATILYGSNAIGGVVNVINNRIPSGLSSLPITGGLDGRFESATLERSGAAAFDLRAGDHLMLHLDGATRRTDSLHIPGHALSERVREGLSPAQRERGSRFGGDPEHIVPNTQVFSRDFGIGASYIWEKGFVGVSFSQFLSVYHTPDNPEVDDPIAPPERVRIDMTKRQYSLRAAIQDPLPWFINGTFKFAYTDYEHLEIEREVVGATFKTNGFDSRLELTHQPVGRLEGSVGVQALNKDFAVLGDEAFLRPTHTLQLAAFVFEEIKFKAARLQAGARVEDNRVSLASGKTRNFIPLSFALGAIHDFTADANAALTVRYSERAPTAEELFAHGPHEATFQFLIGDPDLPKEKVLGIDLTLRKKAGAITGSVGVFYNRFFDFIEFTSTGALEDGLPVFHYTDKRADFFGGEAQVAFHFLPRTSAVRGDGKSVKEIVAGKDAPTMRNPRDFYLEFKADCVRARDLTEDRALPRIPPLRYGAALAYEGPAFGARLEVQRVNPQDRVSKFETHTPGYNFLNASVSYTFGLGATTCDLYLRGTNLTDATAREHTSFLKEVLPLPGRSIAVGMHLAF